LNGGSAAGRLVVALLAEGRDGQLVISQAILHELAEVLARPKFSGRLAPERRRGFLLLLQATARTVEPTERVSACRDPADDMILEAALAATQGTAGPVVVISDDRDLLTLDPWRGIRIIEPEAALELLGSIES
jgi:putative PIN family toxin of toxin-antitoxin system